MFNDVTGLGRRRSSVNTHKEKNPDRWVRKSLAFGKLALGIMPLILILLSCRASNLGGQNAWSTYRNSRYNFEFPYPSHWKPFPVPDNLDGRAFGNPQEPTTQVRGWAGNNLSDDEVALLGSPPIDALKSHQQNFTTEQGLTGKLQVEIGAEISLMKLTLSQGNVRYNWQGQCESEEFDDYYRFFYYIARQYHLSPVDGE